MFMCGKTEPGVSSGGQDLQSELRLSAFEMRKVMIFAKVQWRTFLLVLILTKTVLNGT